MGEDGLGSNQTALALSHERMRSGDDDECARAGSPWTKPSQSWWRSCTGLFPRPGHLGQSTVILVMIQTTTNSARAGHGAGSCAGLEGAFGRTGGVAVAVSAAAVVVGVVEAVAVGSADGDEDQMTATGVVLMVPSGD